MKTALALVAGLTATLMTATSSAAAAGTAGPARGQRVAQASTGSDQLVLPAPTGPHPVGRAVRHLVDADRPDPWVPTEPRELMLSVWYPAAAPRGPRVPYATAEESRLFLEFLKYPDLPPDVLTRVQTHARSGAPPAPSSQRRPLVLLSPGFTDPRWMQTSLAEDLASRGYVVVGVDHPHEGAVVTLPGGRVVVCGDTCGQGLTAEQGVAARAQDLQFVLDSILTDRVFGRLVDARRVASIGHSRGGAGSLALMAVDGRVKAGANMDGSLHPPLTEDLTRPFLLLGGVPHPRPGTRDTSWEATWPHLTTWARWLYVSQMEHRSFSDAAVIGPWLGLPVQPLPGDRSVELTREYMAAFLDQHLRHRPSPLLAGPSQQFPEVEFAGSTG